MLVIDTQKKAVAADHLILNAHSAVVVSGGAQHADTIAAIACSTAFHDCHNTAAAAVAAITTTVAATTTTAAVAASLDGEYRSRVGSSATTAAAPLHCLP